MLRALRAPGGGPALRTRVLAALVIVGMLVAAAPVLIPITRWMVATIAPRRVVPGPPAGRRLIIPLLPA